jgi:hypothetical protein
VNLENEGIIEIDKISYIAKIAMVTRSVTQYVSNYKCAAINFTFTNYDNSRRIMRKSKSLSNIRR